jgi:hypothetical protein
MFVIANPNYTILVLVIHNYREYSNRFQNTPLRVEEGKGKDSEHNDKSAIAEGEIGLYTLATQRLNPPHPPPLLLHPRHVFFCFTQPITAKPPTYKPTTHKYLQLIHLLLPLNDPSCYTRHAKPSQAILLTSQNTEKMRIPDPT